MGVTPQTRRRTSPKREVVDREKRERERERERGTFLSGEGERESPCSLMDNLLDRDIMCLNQQALRLTVKMIYEWKSAPRTR